MRRLGIFLLLCAMALALCGNAGAAPATPKPVRFRQPDGSFITLRIHGDEFASWVTDLDGNLMKEDEDGFYRPAPETSETTLRLRAASARESLSSAVRPVSRSLRNGQRHFLVLPIEFADLSFLSEDPGGAFTAMLNQAGYAENGGTGSARDYFRENSMGVFDPVFDVVGPVRVSQGFAYYGKDTPVQTDVNVGKLLVEACDLVKAQVPDFRFSDYDQDGDGYIDNIFYYFAGHNQAEGAGSSRIWPHSGILREGMAHALDGVQISGYACTSECTGASGTTLCGIGTFCHEFGHVLGLPDLYDTDHADNGQGPGLYGFSLMSRGNYNNDGRTPPYLTAEERMILGWMDEAEIWTTEGQKTLPGIQYNVAGKTLVNNEGEYYLYEVRTGTGWDAFVPAGLLIYHVDRSANLIHGVSAAKRWETGIQINAFASHPGIFIKSSTGSSSDWTKVPFPGPDGARTFDSSSPAPPRDWAGYSTERFLKDITVRDGDGSVSFTYYLGGTRRVGGKVTDKSGNAIEGATVTVCSTDGSGADGLTQITATGAKGTYLINFPAESGFHRELTVSCQGYETVQTAFELEAGTLVKNYKLGEQIRYRGIANPQAGAAYKVGEKFNLALTGSGEEPVSVVWEWDGNPVQGPAVTLEAGEHTVRAILTYADGRVETIRQLICSE